MVSRITIFRFGSYAIPVVVLARWLVGCCMNGGGGLNVITTSPCVSTTLLTLAKTTKPQVVFEFMVRHSGMRVCSLSIDDFGIVFDLI